MLVGTSSPLIETRSERLNNRTYEGKERIGTRAGKRGRSREKKKHTCMKYIKMTTLHNEKYEKQVHRHMLIQLTLWHSCNVILDVVL